MRRKLTTSILTPSLLSRYWSKVNRRSDSECWPWNGARTPEREGEHGPMGGYGRLHVLDAETGKNRTEYAHRICFVMTHGDLDEGFYALHRCDNPSCCNPAHIFAGTPLDNAQDRSKKGRSGGNRAGKGLTRALTPDQERLAGELYSSGLSLMKVAQQLSVSATTIRKALMNQGLERRKRWARCVAVRF
jgi:hypothetical protein